MPVYQILGAARNKNGEIVEINVTNNVLNEFARDQRLPIFKLKVDEVSRYGVPMSLDKPYVERFTIWNGIKVYTREYEPKKQTEAGK